MVGWNQRQTQVPSFVPQVHEVHDSETRLNQRQGQHTRHKLRAPSVLIGQDNLQSR